MEENTTSTMVEEASEVIVEDAPETTPEAAFEEISEEAPENADTPKTKKFSIDPELFTFSPKKQGFNLKTVTAALCVLLVILQVVGFFATPSLQMIRYKNEQLNNIKQNIAGYEESIKNHEAEIETLTAALEAVMPELPTYEAAVEEAKAAAKPFEEALRAAELELDAVCTRSTYNTAFFCTMECEPLHAAVTDAKNALTEAKAVVTACQRELDDYYAEAEAYEREIDNLNHDINSYNNKIRSLKQDSSEVRSELAEIWVSSVFLLLAVLLSVCGLLLLTKLLLEDKVTKMGLPASFAALSLGALMSFVFTAIHSGIDMSSLILYTLLSPHTYAIVAMAMFAKILLKKTEKPVVCRTVAIVAAVASAFAGFLLSGILGTAFVDFAISFLFAIALICLAFIVEPLVFTEYIGIAKHIFLSLITLGIWVAVWTYHVTKNLNKVNDAEERTPKNELLLCMFLPFYAPFWTFKTAELVEAYGIEKERNLRLEAPALVFAFVCPLFATVLIQNKINVIVGKPQ